MCCCRDQAANEAPGYNLQTPDGRPSRSRARFAHQWVRSVIIAILAAGLLKSPAQAAVTVEASAGTPVAPSVLWSLQSEAEREAQAIASALGTDLDETVRILIAKEFHGHRADISRSYPEAFLIIIPPHVLDRRIVPLAHELTHVIAGSGADAVFAEGLAVYNQGRFGTDPAFPNFGRPIGAALREAIMARYGAKTWPEAVGKFEIELGPVPDRTILLSRWIGDVNDTEDRTLAYLTAASYVEYLVDSVLLGDMKAFFRLYRSGDYADLRLTPEQSWSGWLTVLRKY
jgi:hypothetical protein